MKKTLSLFLILTIFLNLFTSISYASSEKGYFVVTAYYSPLPNQKKYLTGNYESEKRLNGQGIAGASGKGVFSGMLAAPSKYAFGTKIYLEGLGVGVVEDRGGAIVPAGKRGYKYDRIDVWMGYGDEGLARALYWGKRTIPGYLVSNNSNTTLDYKKVLSPSWATSGLKSIGDIFSVGLGVKNSGDQVKKLQELLKEVGLYSSSIDGVYNNELIKIIHNFQLDNGLIKSGEIYGAGYWGSSTRSLFKKMYLNGEFDKEELIVQTEAKNEEKINNIFKLDIFKNPVVLINEIKKLQEILTQLGLYSYEINGEYDKNTIDSIYNFQLSKNIISGPYDLGAGTFGPKTREQLKNEYSSYLDKKEEERLEQIRIEQEKKQEEKRKKELEEKYKKLEDLSYKQAKEKIDLIGDPKLGEISPRVRELQILLKELGYFEYKDTAIFGEKTKQSLISYQLDKKIITNQNDNGAGVFGPKTRENIILDLKENFLKNLASKENLDLEEIVAIILEKI